MKTGMSIEKLVYICIIAVVLAFAAQAVQADEYITISWEPPTEREDNTPYTHPDNTAKFTIIDALTGIPILNDIPNTQTQAEILFTTGPHQVVVTITDTEGRESAHSEIRNLMAASSSAPKSMMAPEIVSRRPVQ